MPPLAATACIHQPYLICTTLAPAWLALLQVSDIYSTLSVPNIAALFVFVEISAFHTVLHMYMWVFWSQF